VVRLPCGLSQRIFPDEQDVVFLRDGKHVLGRGVNEFGVYGVLLGDDKAVLHNEPTGHLIRTKVRSVSYHVRHPAVSSCVCCMCTLAMARQGM